MKLRNKIAVTNTLITLVILFVCSAIILKAVDNFNLYTVYRTLLGQSDFSRQYLYEYLKLRDDPEATLAEEREKIEQDLVKQSGCEVTVAGLEEQDASPVQSEALKGNRAYIITDEADGRQFYLASPIFMNDRVIGTVLYRYSLYRVDSMRKSLLYVLLSVFAAAITVSMLLNYFLSFRAIKPLERLTSAAKEFSGGSFKEVEGIATGDEIEKLTHSFNDMGHRIRNMIGELRTEHEKQKKFLDNVTHEIRTPLTNILGYADLISRVADEAQREKYGSYIRDEGNRLVSMINNLLELSQLNRYELSVAKEETDLKALIEKVSSLMMDRAKKFGLDIITDLEQVSSNIDGAKIKQVLINLMDNAIKYSEGNIIEISLRREETIKIRISDNGIGIPEEDINNIMEPFYRVDKSRSRKLGGNGLGLSICRDIIKAHGGDMTIESKANQGTVVTISLQLR